MSILLRIAQTLWLALPVIIAASLHMVIVKKGLFTCLVVPIDGGRTISGRRIFGDNKTWRGVAFVTLASALGGAIQGFLGGAFGEGFGLACVDTVAIGRSAGLSSPAPAHAFGYAVVGAVLGFGYILGELPNSFAKRRFGLDPGAKAPGSLGAAFVVIDRCDSVIVALSLGALVFSYSWILVLVGTAFLSLVHLGVSAALSRARIKSAL